MREDLDQLIYASYDPDRISAWTYKQYKATYPRSLGPRRIRPFRLKVTGAIVLDLDAPLVGVLIKRWNFVSFRGFDLRIGLIPFVHIHLWWYRKQEVRA